jgi:hypothetical protein
MFFIFILLCLFPINIFRKSKLEPISLPRSLHQNIFKKLFFTKMAVASIFVILLLVVFSGYILVVLSIYTFTSFSVPQKLSTPKLSHVNHRRKNQKGPRSPKKSNSVVSRIRRNQSIKSKTS